MSEHVARKMADKANPNKDFASALGLDITKRTRGRKDTSDKRKVQINNSEDISHCESSQQNNNIDEVADIGMSQISKVQTQKVGPVDHTTPRTEDFGQILKDSMKDMHKLIAETITTSMLSTGNQSVYDHAKKRHGVTQFDSDETDYSDGSIQCAQAPPSLDLAVDELLADTNGVDDTVTAADFEDSLESEYLVLDNVGKPTGVKIGTIINTLFQKQMPEERLKELFDKYPRPKNIDFFLTKVNIDIWNRLSAATRSRDIRLQRTQDRILKAALAIVQLADQMMCLKKENQLSDQANNLVKIALDALTLLGSSTQELNQRRRDAIKSDLPVKFKNICNASTNVDNGNSSWLFGDDLSKKLKDINEANKLSTPSISRNYAWQNSKKSNYPNYPNYKRNYKRIPQRGQMKRFSTKK